MSSTRILDAINSPLDLHVLTNEELAILAAEIRQEIIETTARTGGHVASSLGAVEIILAAHSLLNCPTDKLVFDVGHQSYAHKLVTGRREEFQTLRQFGGLSGFPKPQESAYDVHPSGHASDSLSIAAGLAKARLLKGTDEKIVVIIGDAALSGGMAFEALNYIGQAQLPMVIILNDNEMSISHNVGALMKHLGNMRASSSYRIARDSMQQRLEQGGSFGNALVSFGRNMKESIKQFVIPQSMIFESLGIVCSTPIDGHDIGALRETLQVMLQSNGPVLMHVVTKKGVGYRPAEQDPERFHGVGPFDVPTGKSTAIAPSCSTFTECFGQAMVREAATDDRIVAITAAMAGGTGLKPFAREFPDRFIDVGIAEENALGVAAGLAIGGKKPVVAVYSTFMQRAIDQMIIDGSMEGLDIVFALDRAGIVGEDGPTHHGVFDLVYTRMIPHMRVFAPSDEAELAHGLHTALALGGPVAIRYPRGACEGVGTPEEPEVLNVGVSRTLREGTDATVLAFGPLAYRAVEAAEVLAGEGIDVRVVDMRWVKPLDREAIRRACETSLVVTAEMGVVAGGAGAAVLEVMAEEGLQVPVKLLGIPDHYVQQGKPAMLAHELGLDAEGIEKVIRSHFAHPAE